ncbi:virion core protein, T7 gp14 family [Sinorhizobium fredii]|uniref:virion core protein, T7 gp14 family n=1 Tax=Rhizobium fredii TaxID=380 RepID=UPI0035150B13
MAVAQFAMSAASAVVGFQAEESQYEAQRQNYENNRIAANKAAVGQYAATQHRQLQEAKAASQELQNLNREALQQRSTAQVAAAEGGVTGLSVDALINDFYGQEGRHERTLSNNYQMQADYLRGEMEGVQAQTEGRINSVEQPQKPSFSGAAIRILSGGLDALGGYQRSTQLGMK